LNELYYVSDKEKKLKQELNESNVYDKEKKPKQELTESLKTYRIDQLYTLFVDIIFPEKLSINYMDVVNKLKNIKNLTDEERVNINYKINKTIILICCFFNFVKFVKQVAHQNQAHPQTNLDFHRQSQQP